MGASNCCASHDPDQVGEIENFKLRTMIPSASGSLMHVEASTLVGTPDPTVRVVLNQKQIRKMYDKKFESENRLVIVKLQATYRMWQILRARRRQVA